MSSVGVAL